MRSRRGTRADPESVEPSQEVRAVGPVVRSALRAQAAAGLSQAFGAAQLGLLLVLIGPDRSTDAYLVLIALGQVPVQILAMGVLYPQCLAGTEPKSWVRVLALCGGSAAGAVLLGAAYLRHAGYQEPGLWFTAVLLAGGCAALSAATCQAVRLASQGAPVALAGVAVPGNLAAVCGLVVAAGSRSDRPVTVTVMCGALFGGSLLSLLMVTRRLSRPQNNPGATSGPAGAWVGTGRLFGASTAVAVTGVLVQGVLARLPAGQVTEFGVAARIAGFAVTVGVNAALPVLVNKDRFSERAVRTGACVAAWGLPLAVALAAVTVRLVHAPGSLPSGALVAITAFVPALALHSIAVQSVMKEGRSRVLVWASAATLTATGAVLVPAAVAGSTVGVALAVLMGTCAAAAVLCQAMRWRRELLGVAVGVVLCVGVSVVLPA